METLNTTKTATKGATTATKDNFFIALDSALDKAKDVETVLNGELHSLTDIESKRVNEYKTAFNMSPNNTKKDNYKSLVTETHNHVKSQLEKKGFSQNGFAKGIISDFKLIEMTSNYCIDFKFTLRDTLTDRLQFLKTINTILKHTVDNNVISYKLVSLENLLKGDFSTPIMSKSEIQKLHLELLADGSKKYDLKDITKIMQDKKKIVDDKIKAHFDAINEVKEELYKDSLKAKEEALV